MKPVSQNVFQQIEQCETLTALWSLLVRLYRERGFAAIAYVLLGQDEVGRSGALLEHGFPPDTLSRYAALGYGRDDATLRIAMASGRPTLRSKVIERHRMSREEVAHSEAMRSLGVGEVLTLPLYGPRGRDALGALAQPTRASLFHERHHVELHMIAQAAHLRSFCLLPRKRTRGHGLSQREVEILRWVAQGKSNAVIADILALSAGTVDTYLRRIFEKLDVADRTSAAVKGVGLGLVLP